MKLTASEGSSGDVFGFGLSMYGSVIAVGSRGDSANSISGSGYSCVRENFIASINSRLYF